MIQLKSPSSLKLGTNVGIDNGMNLSKNTLFPSIKLGGPLQKCRFVTNYIYAYLRAIVCKYGEHDDRSIMLLTQRCRLGN